MDPRIAKFLKHHHVMALATSSDQGSWTAHCFYAYMHEHQIIVFTSDPETRHGKDMLKNPNVSVGIALETKVIGMIRGIQLSGCATYLEASGGGTPPFIRGGRGEVPGEARTAYLLRFPFALAAKLDLWVLEIDYIKMTDNRLGFGKKLEWRRG